MESRDSLARPDEGAVGLCISCALLRHDFREILGCGAAGDYSSEMALPEAWIDGRHHRLLPYIVSQKTTCKECNVSVPSLYVPIE